MSKKRVVVFICMLSPASAFSVNRRQFWNQLAATAGGAGAIVLSPPPAHAASSQEATDKAKIVKGYQRLTYLLDNWEKETTVCGREDNPYIGCERTPMKVMEVSHGHVFLSACEDTSEMLCADTFVVASFSTWDIEIQMIHCLRWKRR